jgi:hypothetical protein
MSIPKRSENLPQWIDENLPEELLGTNFFEFKVNLRARDPKTKKAKNITINLLPDLVLDRELIEQQMEELPASYVFWSTLYSELRCNVEVLSRAVKIRRGQAIQDVQKRARDEGIKFTGEQVKAVVEADAELNKLEEGLAKAQMQTGKVWHMVKALEMKGDFARSLLTMKRKEYDQS